MYAKKIFNAISNLHICFYLLLILNSCTHNYYINIKKNKPYDCDRYPRDKKAIIYLYKNSISYFNIKNNDTVADIGAQNGSILYNFLSINDSCFFYAQDIDTSCLNQKNLSRVKAYYSKLMQKPIKSKVEIVIGNEKETRLPNNFFNKIIIRDSYHHFTYPKEILNDIKTKLKSTGRVIVFEPLGSKHGEIIKQNCWLPIRTKEEIIQEFDQEGFVLVETRKEKTSKTMLIFEFALKK